MSKPVVFIVMATAITSCGAPSGALRVTALAPASVKYAGEAAVADLTTTGKAPNNGLYLTALGDSKSYVLGYPSNNEKNRRPICSISSSASGNVAIDRSGDLIVPSSYNVSIFAGPKMCGPMLGTLSSGWSGYIVDAASMNASNGVIALAAIQNGSGPGSIELCTLKAGCTSYLRAAGMNLVYSVAMSRTGDCWASWEDGPSKSYAAYMTYFKRCSGNGNLSIGYKNPSAGGMDIDRKGHLLTISRSTAAIYIYSGCNPKCTLIAGPLPLRGTSTYGHLNGKCDRFAVADSQYDKIDVYAYANKALSYLYSFNKGLPNGSGVIGTAFNPSSKQ